MESCTGGFLANQITNQEGSSEILKVSLVTYSNEFKKYFGIKSKTIEKYNEYSNNVSEEMAREIIKISNSNYGIGITGKLGKDAKEILYITQYMIKIKIKFITIRLK
jgi:nicotinamide-nucleotide amidase